MEGGNGDVVVSGEEVVSDEGEAASGAVGVGQGIENSVSVVSELVKVGEGGNVSVGLLDAKDLGFGEDLAEGAELSLGTLGVVEMEAKGSSGIPSGDGERAMNWEGSGVKFAAVPLGVWLEEDSDIGHVGEVVRGRCVREGLVLGGASLVGLEVGVLTVGVFSVGGKGDDVKSEAGEASDAVER